ncbi:unnamed protein product [Adineta steineri]|uniref:Uncharacterized protein n=1 Tax=Adineta steineri TaxID=433720 RepID=A0A819Z4D1_9BILA|nr:unnamed protein product [Adineta steineri]CAF4165259.1 unnamed protein product [Adineta steineri]
MKRSVEQLKHIDHLSRQVRHHRIHLNQMYDQKLSQELHTLTKQYAQTLKYSKKEHKLERRRKEVFDVTIRQIANERQHPSLSTNIIQNEQKLPKISNQINGHRDELLENCSSSNNIFSSDSSCQFFSQDCQLYPCQPVYHYTSFMTKDHDQTLRKRKLSIADTDLNLSPIQQLFTKIEQKKYHQNRRQLAATVKNQNYLANRYVYIGNTKARLDEQSRLLHERLTDKRTFGYDKEQQKELRQSIKRHLEISAKFLG